MDVYPTIDDFSLLIPVLSITTAETGLVEYDCWVDARFGDSAGSQVMLRGNTAGLSSKEATS